MRPALLAFLLLPALHGEDLKPPTDIPDPFGLGPRLALVDYLKDQLHVAPEPGASYEELVALYWKTVDKPKADADADRKDRIEQLRFRLKHEFNVEAGDSADETELTERLKKCEQAATVRVVEQADPTAPAKPADAPAAKPPTRAASGADPVWLTDFAAACAQAKSTKLPILIDFTGSDWCGWCMKLHDEVFSQPEFKEWAATHVVLLVVDFPHETKLPEGTTKQNEELEKRYQITGVPTILVVSPDGKELGQRFSYLAGGPKQWVEQLTLRVPGLAGDR